MPSVPPFWQWVGLVVGFVALGLSAMALPTVFQMWWGRPDIDVEFGDSTDPKGKVLKCYIVNRPVMNKLLRRLRVSRDAADIWADLEVCESGGKEVLPMRPVRINVEDGPSAQRVRLAAPFPGVVAIAVAPTHGVAYVYAPDDDEPPQLNAGRYKATVTVLWAGGRKQQIREFRIGKTFDETYWMH